LLILPSSIGRRRKGVFTERPNHLYPANPAHPFLQDCFLGYWFNEQAGVARPIGRVGATAEMFSGAEWTPDGFRCDGDNECARTSVSITPPTSNFGLIIRMRVGPTSIHSPSGQYFFYCESYGNYSALYNVSVHSWTIGGTQFLFGADGNIDDGDWHTIVINTDSSNTTFYIDGVLKATKPNPFAAVSDFLAIGGRDDNTGRWWGGDVAYFRIHSAPIPLTLLDELHERPYAPFDRRVWVPIAAPGGPITGTGALQAGNAAVAGIGTASGVKTGTGTLLAQDAAVAGVGVGVLEGTGALAAQSASVSGAGAIVQDGTGALQAQDAAVSGIGELGAEKSGSGTLQAQDAAVSGAALRIPVGTGALQAQSAAVSGEGVTQDLISGTGVLQAQSAAVVGFGEFAFEGVGALQAQSAVVAGTGFLLGELTLTPADLAAIQDAVWAKLVNEGLVGQINELWQRRGLDPAAPQTYDKAGNQIRVGGVTIDLTGDQNAVTQTRQP